MIRPGLQIGFNMQHIVPLRHLSCLPQFGRVFYGKCLICDTKTDSLATRNHPPFYLRSDTKSDSFATHAPLGSIGGTGDRGQGLGGTGVRGVRGDKGLSYHMRHSHTFRVYWGDRGQGTGVRGDRG